MFDQRINTWDSSFASIALHVLLLVVSISLNRLDLIGGSQCILQTYRRYLADMLAMALLTFKLIASRSRVIRQRLFAVMFVDLGRYDPFNTTWSEYMQYNSAKYLTAFVSA